MPPIQAAQRVGDGIGISADSYSAPTRQRKVKAIIADSIADVFRVVLYEMAWVRACL